MMIFNSEEELLKYTSNIIGKKFKDFDSEGLLENASNDKGILGKIIEKGFYHYPNNNIAAADFEKLGIELKVTGYVKNKNGTISAKERLVLGMINYQDIINEDFNFSKLLFKNKKILIIWYEYDYTKEIKDFTITNYQLYDMTNDELIIKNDYNIIKEKIVEGKAHLLSEGDTSYLGACVKGANGEQKVSQPMSDFMAKPRAFSLKHSYLTGILRNTDFIFEVDNLEYKTVEEYVYAQIKKFIGKTQADIYEELFNQQLSEMVPKNIGKMISDKIIGKDDELPEKNSLFSKTTYKIKNIPVDNKYYPLERLPFRTIRLSEFDYSWNLSDWKVFFEEITIIALCYEGTKETANGFRKLKDIKKITFNEDDIDSFEITYNMIKKAIDEKDISLLPYPGSFPNQKLEIAPKGQKGANAYETFFDNDKTKVCFMMNKEFVYSKLNEENDESPKEEDTNNIYKTKDKDNDNMEELLQNNPIDKYNIFQLYDFGISRDSIEKIADNRIPPYNILINNGSKLRAIGVPKSKCYKIVEAIRSIINNKIEKRHIYELMYQGISKQLCDNLISKELSIKLLSELSTEKLINEYNLGNSTTKRIKDAILSNNIIIEESNSNLNTSRVMMEILKNNTIEKPISVFEFKQLLSKSNYRMDNYLKDYSQLLNEGYIENTLFGIKYKYQSYFDVIKDILNEREYEIVIKRYEGITLEEIAGAYNLTRERVRQIEAKALQKVKRIVEGKTFYEDKYKTIFTKYPWNKKLFCEVTGYDSKIYSYLKMKYFSKQYDNDYYDENIQNFYEIINDDNFSPKQKQRLKEIAKIVILPDGSIMDGKKEFLRKFMVEYASDEIEVDKLVEIYNEEIKKYPELELNETTSRNLEGKLSRLDYAFFGLNHKVRYFDFCSLSEESVEQLKELIILSDGFYSTEYLFNSNMKLMNELDIRNEYELHNILKLKIDDDDNNVYFLRMPNFLVEYTDKDEFILDKIREYSPILVNEFVDILYEEYGHKKNTMLAYLNSNFSSYIKNGCFDIETISLSGEEINYLKNKLKKDIYIYSEIEDILIENGYTNTNQIITNRNFVKIGYVIRGSYIIKREYGGIFNYFDEKIKNDEIIRLSDELAKNGAIYHAICYYSKNLEIFKIATNIYVTSKKLNSLGTSKNELTNLISNIKERFIDRDYFSIGNIYDEFECTKYEEIGLPKSFIEDIMFYQDDVKTLRINNNRLFSYSKKSMTISNFMYDMVNKYSSISLDDLEREIMRNYQISVPFDKLRGYIYSTDIFYSDILGKIYSDKNYYYEEVYDGQ